MNLGLVFIATGLIGLFITKNRPRTNYSKLTNRRNRNQYNNSITEQRIDNSDVVIGLMGDVMIGRLVNDVIGKKGFIYPWGNTLPILKQNDINLINLETTLTNSNRVVPKVFNFKAYPDRVKTLQAGNITVANLANNHGLDFSEEGLLETIKVLDQANIKHVGAGLNMADAQNPILMNVKGVSIGLIGFTDNEPTWKAGNNKPGTNYIHIVRDIDEIVSQIKRLRPQVDILIVTTHWGPNNRLRPTQSFVTSAHAIIDAGADVLHGHSAHVFQGIEVYKNKLIIYDSGDFVDDYMVSSLRNDQSFLFQLLVNKSGLLRLVMIPVLIENMQVNLAEKEDRNEIIQRMKYLSNEFGTSLMYERNDVLELIL